MTKSQEDRRLDASIGAFEAAAHARAVELPAPLTPGVVLEVFDGSNQDRLVNALTSALVRHTGGRVIATHADPSLDAEAAMQAIASYLPGEAPTADEEVATVFTGGATAAIRILEARKAVGAGLIVMPAPCVSDLDELGENTVGETTELVLASRPDIPVLLVRDPDVDADACFRRMLVLVDLHPVEAGKAISAALALCEPGATVQLVGLVHEDALAEVRDLVGDEVEEDLLSPAHAETAAGKLLAGHVAAANRRARERDVSLSIRFQVGTPQQVARALSSASDQLLVTGCSEDASTIEFSRVLELVRYSRMPVLVV